MQQKLPFILFLIASLSIFGQSDKAKEQINSLIDTYAMARENGDSTLLQRILTKDIDQLVSTGEWRNGLDESLKGMQRSTTTKPGTRTLTVEKIKFPTADVGVVDARYIIQNADGEQRKMWSTFIVVREKGIWKITAIRNMFPTGDY